MTLTKFQRQFRFVYLCNTWYLDIMELRNSKYLQQQIEPQKLYITIFYEAARHRLFICPKLQKSAQQTLESYLSFKQYIQKLPEQKCVKIICDEGNEYKGAFQKQLEKDHIEVEYINSQMNDKLMLSPINIYCRYVRNSIYKMMIEFSGKKEADDNLNFNFTFENIIGICDKISDLHNYDKMIRYYKKPPFKITPADVHEYNKHIIEHNQEVETRNYLKIGDVVKIQLKHEELNKGRVKKWSYSNYVIINKYKNHYALIQQVFNEEQFRIAFNIPKKKQVLQPVIFRKFYELTDQNLNQPNYLPLEIENTTQFCFIKILKAFTENGEEKDFKKFQQSKQKDYQIQTTLKTKDSDEFQNYIVHQSEMQKFLPQFQKLHPAEQLFWLDQKPQCILFDMKES